MQTSTNILQAEMLKVLQTEKTLPLQKRRMMKQMQDLKTKSTRGV